MAASGTRPPSVADTTFHRQSLEVGARCVNCARRDLCGGRAAMLVPTAIEWPLLGGRRGLPAVKTIDSFEFGFQQPILQASSGSPFPREFAASTFWRAYLKRSRTGL